MEQLHIKPARFKRPCKKCGNMFNPSGKFNYICSGCNNKGKYWRDLNYGKE